MDSYGVLIVDDSPLMRKLISEIIESCPQLHVVGKARNGKDAIEKITRLKPQVVTLDIEMPEMDGIELLKIIGEEYKIPTIMLASDSEYLIESLELGAIEFYLKKQLIGESLEIHYAEFHQKLIAAASANIIKLEEMRKEKAVLDRKEKLVLPNEITTKLIVIGSSTGGPSAVQSIITQFPSNFKIPILIIQHMPAGFTKPLAMRFDNLCALPVKEAEADELLAAGTIYIAPAGIHTTIERKGQDQYIFKQGTETTVDTLYKPSIDVTLLSLKEEQSLQLITIILTGMGDDGLKGCTAVKKNGAKIISQSEETCVVYGMPKVVYEAGIVDKQLPLDKIFEGIIELVI